MSRTTQSTPKTTYFMVALTQGDIMRLNKENSLSVLEGESGLVLKDTPIFGRYVLDSKGEISKTKKGEPIRALYTIVVVKRVDGQIIAGKVTLSWLAGEDLVLDPTCPLLFCSDGIRKYAATYKCTPALTRDFCLNLQAGDDKFPYDLCVKGDTPIEAFKLPSFDEIWKKVDPSSNVYVNVDGLKERESVELKKVRRSVLRTTDMDWTEEDLEKAKQKVALAVAALRLQ